jgi:serine/threonine-protein kinase
MRSLDVGEVLDGYRIEALVARGGMASIFRAVDTESGEVVALKVPHLHYEADVVFYERFRREEELALRLDHPNLVRARPPRREKTRLYLVMEYVDGVSVAALLAGGRALPPAQALDVARQTCDALAYLHALGVVHHDVKPGNVLVTAAGRVKLLDFGVAHVETARRLTIGGLSASVGTPDYMAPEQLRGRAGDARADLYALGIMLYELLTGRLPWEGADWEERARGKRLEDPAPPSSRVSGLEPGLEAIVMKAIDPDIGQRYQTAADLLADLRNPSAVASRVEARPRGRRRRRVDARLLAAILSVVAALGIVASVAWLGVRRGVDTVSGGSVARPAVAAPRGAARP